MSQRLAPCPDSVGLVAETVPKNEPVKSYAPGSPERASIKAALARMESDVADLPLFVGGLQLRTTRQRPVVMPHRHHHTLAQVHQADADHVEAAIAACRAAAPDWSRASAAERASIFLKAADLLAGPWRD